MKNDDENTTKKYRYFIKSNFVGVNRLFVLISSNQDDNSKDLKLVSIIFKNMLLRIIMLSSLERTFMTNQLIVI